MKFWEDIRNRVFVFGSNQAGVHGGGAARFARENFGAVMGFGEGRTGLCYALPTKVTVNETMTLEAVRAAVDRFLEHARAHPADWFQVTAVGCGLAGLSPEDIAPMFRDAPENCWLPGVWKKLLNPEAYSPRVIVAGSRNIRDGQMVFEKLDKLLVNLAGPGLEIVSGLAAGPDSLGKEWADQHAVATALFPADWKRFGKKAGFIRNQDMSWYGTHLVAFWDGQSSGTRNMIETAERDGLTVKVVHTPQEVMG
ncbi:hypothetical protein BAE47_02860 [Acidithiobacillus thiooxidans]|uniref:A1S_2505 family phage non-structural protein n=2 Tax=Acidithiobacillus thiooxidans TaxID=930 RepID=UPI0004ADFD1E|nr:SLOG family protein [Acidithiobacillus thiooxidans]OFC50253.1 hypothetical protein BAE47_02860 [Acidithiobacillus thiooxidans]